MSLEITWQPKHHGVIVGSLNFTSTVTVALLCVTHFTFDSMRTCLITVR